MLPHSAQEKEEKIQAQSCSLAKVASYRWFRAFSLIVVACSYSFPRDARCNCYASFGFGCGLGGMKAACSAPNGRPQAKQQSL
jgi:hypothetical protein